MTQEHPIIPPPELVEQWMTEIWHEGTPVRVAASDLHIATQAANWGADQELEACCEYEATVYSADCADGLRRHRRPKPPSLKEQALETIVEMANCMKAGFIPKRIDLDNIRRALETLPD